MQRLSRAPTSWHDYRILYVHIKANFTIPRSPPKYKLLTCPKFVSINLENLDLNIKYIEKSFVRDLEILLCAALVGVPYSSSQLTHAVVRCFKSRNCVRETLITESWRVGAVSSQSSHLICPSPTFLTCYLMQATLNIHSSSHWK